MSPVDSNLIGPVVARLKELFGERCNTGTAMREQHGRGEAYTQGYPPDAVVFPESTAEVSEVLKLCHANSVPVIAFGAGT